MNSKIRIISRPTPPPSPFERWMNICLAPVAAQLEAIDSAPHEDTYTGRLLAFDLWLVVMAETLVFCGAGLAVWCVLKGVALAMRKTQRPKYYPAETMRRRALAAERRSVRRRITVNAAPTREELLAQFARVKRNPREMIRFGSMLCDLEAYVDNSLRRNENGVIVGRNPGIRGWFAENCVELGARYKTVMRYKAMAERFRQVVGLRDPLPAALALDADGADGVRENTVRKEIEMGEKEGKIESENTVRKVSLEESVVIGKARKRAAEFFAKCGVSMRGACAELGERLGPENVPGKVVAEERLRQGLSPEPGFVERFVAAVLA